MSTTGASILLVEDEKRLLDSCRQLLEAAGYFVVTAPGGQEAISLLKAERFDLMLLDLNMPEIDGLDVLDYLNQAEISLKTLIVSGETSFEWVSQAFKKGAYDFIQKPYEVEALINTVENALQKDTLEKNNQVLVDQLAQSEKLHRFLIESSPDIIFIVDNEGNIAFVNDRARTLLGYEKSNLVGKHFSFIVAPESLDMAAHCFLARKNSSRSVNNQEILLKSKPGYNNKLGENCRVTIELNAVGVFEPKETESEHWLNSFKGTYVVASDITEKLETQKTIFFQAYHDLLTGLPNRSLFMDRLGVAINNAKREKRNLAIMFLDLDRFKTVNDTLGHSAGDALLKVIAGRLKSILRESDTLARIGGDEFMLLLPDATSVEIARNVAEKIVDVVKEPVPIEGHDIFVTVSIGVSIYPDDGETTEALIKNSDIAMYQAKDQGKNGYQLYASRMSEKHHYLLSIESEIRKGILDKQFEVFYQPQVNADSEQIVGVEALLRWNHPERGLLTPNSFLTVAEECGAIIELGNWVLENAIAEVQNWRNQGVNIQKLAINFTSRQIEHPGFVEKVAGLLEAYGLPGHCLEVEITESTLMNNIESTVSILRELNKMGIQVAIDDFGTGYSSLSMLQKLPINRLKIDKSFIKDITDHSDRSIIEAIAHMAKGLNLDMVAEGVEEEYQLNYLKQLNCQIVQGYYFSEGKSAVNMRKMLDAEAVLLLKQVNQ